MKKMLTVFAMVVMLAFASFSYGQVTNWRTANQVTFAWDPVTTVTDQNGNPQPIPSGEIISYSTYDFAPPVDRSQATLIHSGIVATQDTITFTIQGKYIIGVKGVLSDNTGAELSESAIVWSDDPKACLNGQTFGISFYFPPVSPGGLH